MLNTKVEFVEYMKKLETFLKTALDKIEKAQTSEDLEQIKLEFLMIMIFKGILIIFKFL